MAVRVNEATGIHRVMVESVREENLELIARASRGDLAAFREFIGLYSTRVYTIAYQMIGNADDAQDIAQEVFIRLYRSLDRFSPTGRFTTWLYRVTVNMTIDYQRQHARHRHVPLEEALSVQDCGPSPDVKLEFNDLHGAIERLAGNLSLKQRTVFVLRDLQGFTTEEIAGILKCRPSTVRVHLARARGQVRQALTEQYPDFFGGNK